MSAEGLERGEPRDLDGGAAASPAASDPPGRRSVGRRRFLGVLAGAGLATLPIAWVFGKGGGGRSPRAAATGASPTAPPRLRRWSMIIDLRRCDGCQSQNKPPLCTAACIEGHFVPDPMQWIEVYEPDLPGGGTQFVPTPCQQCQNAPCTNVCPVGATFATPEGVVLIDQERCIGCRICMAACPYDRRFFNWGDPPVPPEAMAMQYMPEHQTPAIKGTVMKCDFCPDMAGAGRLPYCAQACPNHAIYYGDLEEGIATNGDQVVDVNHFLAANAAYRLKEDLGTEPRVFYIPGYGQKVGRSPFKRGRLATIWPWKKVAKGSETWTR